MVSEFMNIQSEKIILQSKTNIFESVGKKAAANKRFGVSGGVGTQKWLCKFASLSPARTLVKPPPTPSRQPLAKESKPKRFEYKNCQDLLSGIIRENEIRKIYI